MVKRCTRCSMTVTSGKKDGWESVKRRGGEEKYSKDCSGRNEAKKRKVRRPPEIFPSAAGRKIELASSGPSPTRTSYRGRRVIVFFPFLES